MKSPEVSEPIDKRVKKTGFKSPDAVKKSNSSTTSSEPTPTRRRSVRFKDDEKKQDSSGNESSGLTVDNKGKKGTELNAKSTKISHEINTETEEKSDAVITNHVESIVKDSEDKTKAATDKSACHKISPEKDLGLMEAEVMLEKCDSQVSPDRISVNEKPKSDESSESNNIKLSSSESDKGFSLSNQSVPQNVLGALGPTPESSSKSSETKRQTVTTLDNAKTDMGQEDDESQPLFSWTKKLNQLNKSPRSESPLRQITSPERKGSPLRTRSQSPMKSPKRAKKKLTNESYGNLDKWVIRSPVKSVGIEKAEKIADNILTVGSATFVEETQSPTKFTKNKLDDGDDKNDSVMETPPKSDFINSSVAGYGNSNRKLFQSSQENIENMHNILEDSNIIAASPNAKSVKPGTPILKLTRLTDSEIKKYSPGKDGRKELEFTPTKSAKKKSVTTVFDLGGKNIIDQSPKSKHRHDDFTAFKPVEIDNQNKADTNEFFSKSLTDTDRAMLKLNDNEKSADSDSERMDMSQSDSETPELSQPSQNVEIRGLFSQIVKEAKLEAEMHNDIPFEQSADIFTQGLETAQASQVELQSQDETQDSQQSQDETQDSQQSQGKTLDSQQSQNETQSQDETQDSQQSYDETQDSQEKEVKTPKRGRKRKQETLKKTPDEVKRGRRKKTEENSLDSLISRVGSAQKVSRRLREKREKIDIQLSQINSPPDSKRASGKELEVKDKSELSCQEENVESKKTKESMNASSDKKCIDHAETENIMKEKSVTETSEQEPPSAMKEQEDKYDECGNIIESENEEKSLDNDNGKVNATDTVVTACNEEKKNDDEIVNKERESGGNDNKLENSRKKGSKKDMKPLKKKITSSQEEKLQKTPESRNSSVQPERKSTTKKRKEVAQKRVMNRGKDVVVNDSDSNLDQDLSDEDLPVTLHISKKAVAENLEKKIDEQLCKEIKCTVINRPLKESDKSVSMELDDESKGESEENMEDNGMKGRNENNEIEKDENDSEAMDVSFCSDDMPLSSLKSSQDEEDEDDIPLSNLKSIQEDPKQMNGDKIETELDKDEEKMDKAKGSAKKVTRKQKQNTSPIVSKLRSVKTRLRSGEKKSVTLQGKNKLSLKSKRVNSAKKKLNIESKKKKKGESGLDIDEIEKDATVTEEPEPSEPTAVEEKPAKDSASKETSEKAMPEPECDAEENIPSEHSNKLDIGPQMEGFAGMKDESTSTASISRPTNPVFNILDETPTKVIESPKRLPVSTLVRNSDSKLILGSRKFDRRSSLARRSILKPSSVGSPRDVNSPKRDFHPIKLPRIYSPTASPSASILKKRRLSDDPTSDTNSPPSKVS